MKDDRGPLERRYFQDGREVSAEERLSGGCAAVPAPLGPWPRRDYDHGVGGDDDGPEPTWTSEVRQFDALVVEDRIGKHYVLTILDGEGSIWIRRAPLDPTTKWERVTLPWETGDDEGGGRR